MQKFKKPNKGSERVKSWVYRAINPLIKGIIDELSILSKGETSWLYRTQKTEIILRCDQYIEYQYNAIYMDFLKTPYAKNLLPYMSKHDTLLDKLNKSALQTALYLKEQPDFIAFFKESLKKFQQRNTYPGGALPEQRLDEVVIEYLINNIHELSSHYTTKEYWDKYKNSFYAIRDKEQQCLSFQKQVAKYFQFDIEFENILDGLRFDICEEFDIPAAPINLENMRQYPSGSF